MKVNHRLSTAAKRQRRVRAKVRGTTERPRLCVFRSNKSLYLQVIDDEKGKTVVAAGSYGKKIKAVGTKTERAAALATQLAEKMKKAAVKKIVFDRGSYQYHGRVRTVAETLRAAGIEF